MSSPDRRGALSLGARRRGREQGVAADGGPGLPVRRGRRGGSAGASGRERENRQRDATAWRQSGKAVCGTRWCFRVVGRENDRRRVGCSAWIGLVWSAPWCSRFAVLWHFLSNALHVRGRAGQWGAKRVRAVGLEEGHCDFADGAPGEGDWARGIAGGS